MTVIVMIKNKDTYHIIGDGRTSQDWMGVATDNSVKVHEGKDCIYGVCGNASAKLIIKEMLAKTRNPIQILRLFHHKDFKDILQDCIALVATKKHGAYTISCREHKGLGRSFDTAVVTWDDDALPQCTGSGFLQVRTLLNKHKKELTPTLVKESIAEAYETNHTIGGKISQVSLPLTTHKKKKK